MSKIITFTFCFLFCFHVACSQKTIELRNPSFEDTPHAGNNVKSISGWRDCGAFYFDNESPPDIHLGMNEKFTNNNTFFNVNEKATHGYTFLGMVVRENETHEAVGQKLSSSLEAGKCYSFSIDLSRSKDYISPYNPGVDNINSKNFTTPVVFVIYGGRSICNIKELLAESIPVENTSWKRYEFEFRPSENYSHIILGVYFDTSNEESAYNGNLLLDNASSIMEINCTSDEK